MKQPRYTDTARYRMPYVRAAFSRAPGYLRRRFDKFCPNWRKPADKALGK
jgi:hypothetical protein